MHKRSFGLASLMGVITLLAVSFGLIHAGIRSDLPHAAMLGCVLLAATLGGVASFVGRDALPDGVLIAFSLAIALALAVAIVLACFAAWSD